MNGLALLLAAAALCLTFTTGSCRRLRVVGVGVPEEPLAVEDEAYWDRQLSMSVTATHDTPGGVETTDDGADDGGQDTNLPGPWPECENTDTTAVEDCVTHEECKSIIDDGNHGVEVIFVPEGSAVTADYRVDRVRIYYDSNNCTVGTPRVGRRL